VLSEDALVTLFSGNDDLNELVESKASFIETMISAAISNHLDHVDVSGLIVTILSMLRLSTVWLPRPN
jgi:hypothetical protein